jgi:hypothetical protein
MALPQPREGATALVTAASSLLGRHVPHTISLPITKRAWGQVE